MTPMPHELILGGARSGKSRCAEQRALRWLQADRSHRATLLATALAADDEMRARIERHRADRAARVPAMATVEAPAQLGATLERLAEPGRLLLVDCLTLWLTQCLLPPPGVTPELPWAQELQALLAALHRSVSPVVLVSNEIGLGPMPAAPEARAAVDALGQLHQAVAARCRRVTLMVAGCELQVKDAA